MYFIKSVRRADKVQTEYKMQLICDGVRHKREVLEQSVEEYKEVYIKAKREFETIVEVGFALRMSSIREKADMREESDSLSTGRG